MYRDILKSGPACLKWTENKEREYPTLNYVACSVIPECAVLSGSFNSRRAAIRAIKEQLTEGRGGCYVGVGSNGKVAYFKCVYSVREGQTCWNLYRVEDSNRFDNHLLTPEPSQGPRM